MYIDLIDKNGLKYKYYIWEKNTVVSYDEGEATYTGDTLSINTKKTLTFTHNIIHIDTNRSYIQALINGAIYANTIDKNTNLFSDVDFINGSFTFNFNTACTNLFFNMFLYDTYGNLLKIDPWNIAFNVE